MSDAWRQNRGTGSFNQRKWHIFKSTWTECAGTLRYHEKTKSVNYGHWRKKITPNQNIVNILSIIKKQHVSNLEKVQRFTEHQIDRSRREAAHEILQFKHWKHSPKKGVVAFDPVLKWKIQEKGLSHLQKQANQNNGWLFDGKFETRSTWKDLVQFLKGHNC